MQSFQDIILYELEDIGEFSNLHHCIFHTIFSMLLSSFKV